MSYETDKGRVSLTSMLSYYNEMDRGAFFKRIVILFLALASVLPAWAEPDGMQGAGTYIIEKYNQALKEQQAATRDMAMTVTIQARLPKLKKQGKLNALRRISSIGRVTYKFLGFQGDDMVKREVIARYMNADQDASDTTSAHPVNIAINPENYSFKYKGLSYRSARPVHVFELKPRHKRVGLFKGELWLDPDTCLPIHEQGQFVKTPSVFVKKMQFTRDYQITNGVSVLKHMEAKTDTRLVGTAELAIDYDSPGRQAATGDAVEEAGERD